MNACFLVAKELKEGGKVACLAAADKTQTDAFLAVLKDETAIAAKCSEAGLSGEVQVELLRRAPYIKRRDVLVAEKKTSKRFGRD